MALDFDDLTEGEVVFGIGGSQTEFTEQAEVSFYHGATVVTYYQDIDIAPVTKYNQGLPSLLGMDIIQHWRMVCDVQNEELSFEVHHADDVRGMDTP